MNQVLTHASELMNGSRPKGSDASVLMNGYTHASVLRNGSRPQVLTSLEAETRKPHPNYKAQVCLSLFLSFIGRQPQPQGAGPPPSSVSVYLERGRG